MDSEPGPSLVTELRVAADYGQIYIYSPRATRTAFAERENLFLDALADATDSRRFVGLAGGLIDLLTPGQWNWDTPMRIEVWPSEPPASEDDWDHEVDLDLDIPDGTLVFEASGGGEPFPTEVPPGRYRARVSGGGFVELGQAGADGGDEYRLRLWPRAAEREPELRRSWAGWADYR